MKPRKIIKESGSVESFEDRKITTKSIIGIVGVAVVIMLLIGLFLLLMPQPQTQVSPISPSGPIKPSIGNTTLIAPELSITEKELLITEDEAEKFIDKELAMEETESLEKQLDLYADAVDYFKAGFVDKQYIRNDKQKYFDRWPKRKYLVQQPISFSYDVHDKTKIIVIFNVNFYAESEKKIAAGVAKNILTLQKIDDKILITSIKGYVINRKVIRKGEYNE
jgi:hypothetical protein